MSDRGVDDWFPLDAEEHARQLAGVRAALRAAWGAPARAPAGGVLDLGCGGGRIARPLGEEGWRVVGVDRDEAALARAAGGNVRAVRADLLDEEAELGVGEGEALAALCLGHTFMLVTDPVAAQRLVSRVGRLLRAGGFYAIDAFVDPLWEDVAGGGWRTGISEDGQWQMIWERGESVVALRRGEAVDEGEWSIRANDLRVRLWTWGELRLLAHGAGLSAPEVSVDGSLILFRRV